MLFHSKTLSLVASCFVLVILSVAGESSATPVAVKVSPSSPTVAVTLKDFSKCKLLRLGVGQNLKARQLTTCSSSLTILRFPTVSLHSFWGPSVVCPHVKDCV
jgi:hypothetical protein